MLILKKDENMQKTRFIKVAIFSIECYNTINENRVARFFVLHRMPQKRVMLAFFARL